jgi:uncharacterized protein (TIGR03086 family)
MDTIDTMTRVIEETRRVVDGIDESQLANPSPCAEWTVRDVLNHVTAGAKMFTISVRDGSIPDAQLGALMTGDNVGADFKGSFGVAANEAEAAFAEPGVLDKVVKLPFGEMPAGVALNIAIFDLTTHAWDLAKATGQSTELDPEVLQAALGAARAMLSDDLRATGRFGPEVPVSAGAPLQDQLAGLTGRTP